MNISEARGYLEHAAMWAEASDCQRRHVGAVAVRDGSIIITGFNRSIGDYCRHNTCLRKMLDVPSGERHELCRAVHAEQMIITEAARCGISLIDCDLLITCSPCSICAKLIASSGIRSVYYSEGYPDTLAMDILRTADVKLIKVEGV